MYGNVEDTQIQITMDSIGGSKKYRESIFVMPQLDDEYVVTALIQSALKLHQVPIDEDPLRLWGRVATMN